MDVSGWEIVEQEKCKLIYAQFFDGVQCFDSGLGRLHIATPDFEFNTYDPVLKKLTTKTYSIYPVTPSDLNYIQRPLLLLNIDMSISGLVVKLTADAYEKTRIIPLFYLTSCNTTNYDGLNICLAIYQEELVTSVSFEAGRIDFLSSSVFKYTDVKNVAHLYRLKDNGKNIIVYDIPDNFSNIYYFPAAYYVEKLPPEVERAIRHNYKYAKPYKTYDMSIFPCTYTGSSTRYLFNSNIEYIKDSNNIWRFILRLYTESYTMVDNRLSLSVILRDSVTGLYRVETYAYDFFTWKNPIDLEALSETIDSKFGSREFSGIIGPAQCKAYFMEYFKDPVLLEAVFKETVEVPSYGFPTCPNVATYDITVCECTGGNLCWDKFVLPCEECNPDTGVIKDTCTAPARCTIFDCHTNATHYACICGSEFGIDTFPAVQATFLTPSCKMIKYDRYILTRDGDVKGHVSLAELLPASEMGIMSGPWLRFFNIYDLIPGNKYDYDGVTKTVDQLVFLALKYLKVDFIEVPANKTTWNNPLRGYVTLDDLLSSDYIDISYEEVIAMIPGAGSMKLDWGTQHWDSKGAYTVQGQPCMYQSVTITVTKAGSVTHAYNSIQGFYFIYPMVTVQPTAHEAILAYSEYCEKVKWLGHQDAYTFALYKDTISKSATSLEI